MPTHKLLFKHTFLNLANYQEIFITTLRLRFDNGYDKSIFDIDRKRVFFKRMADVDLASRVTWGKIRLSHAILSIHQWEVCIEVMFCPMGVRVSDAWALFCYTCNEEAVKYGFGVRHFAKENFFRSNGGVLSVEHIELWVLYFFGGNWFEWWFWLNILIFFLTLWTLLQNLVDFLPLIRSTVLI